MRAIDFEKPPGRATLTEAYKFINFRFDKIRKQPHFEKNSAGMEDGSVKSLFSDVLHTEVIELYS